RATMKVQGWTEFECVVLDGEPTVVEFRGELDLSTLAEVESRVDELGKAKRSFVIDLSGLTFIDSQGLGLLVRIHQTAIADGCTVKVVRGDNSALKRALDISGLSDILDFVD
ncbi:MAG: hypothetical protein JWM71_2237, partial [Solirubrobacteraceae bacterium]|nr:hypothetical protein [Solirubrobacteraceae bacterium]